MEITSVTNRVRPLQKRPNHNHNMDLTSKIKNAKITLA